MKSILIASFDMEVGGVERSLISMLDNFDYDNYDVDLMLYSHSGEFMDLVSKKANLLEEDKKYKTFRMSVGQTIKSLHIGISLGRILARLKSKGNGTSQMQYMWKYTLPLLPRCRKQYDVAISYLWPHYFVAEKVDAKVKIAWIHTDYSIIDTDIELDLKMWDKFDYIVAVSEDCKKSFLNKYPSLLDKVIVIENITSPSFVKKLSEENVDDFDIDEGIFKVLSVGRYCEAKGFDNAIKALRILKDRGYENIKWFVVGYGGDEDMLKRLIKENNLEDDFILLGKKTNPYPYMKQCDLYAQPSRYEGKAVTVSEAQILGKCVMLTNYNTAHSQVKDEIDGYITELSIDGVVDGIDKLYKNKEFRKKLEHNCKVNNYTNNYELEKLYDIFRMVE